VYVIASKARRFSRDPGAGADAAVTRI